MKATVPLDLKAELQAALKPDGWLGKDGCYTESAAVQRALRGLLDRAKGNPVASPPAAATAEQ